MIFALIAVREVIGICLSKNRAAYCKEENWMNRCYLCGKEGHLQDMCPNMLYHLDLKEQQNQARKEREDNKRINDSLGELKYN